MTRGIQRAIDAEQTHPKVNIQILTKQPCFTAGTNVSGVVQLECVSEKIYLGDIWLELHGTEGVCRLLSTEGNLPLTLPPHTRASITGSHG